MRVGRDSRQSTGTDGQFGSVSVIQTKSVQESTNFDDVRINWDAFETHVALKRVLSYWLETHRAISVTEAASRAAMTPAYFSRFFHDKVGVTFKYWIDFMRINAAASLLHSANKTVIEVVEECGFHDPTTFTRTFRRILGLTPLEFKRRRQRRAGLAAPPLM
jgi:transcriptional regulator GlxA family with amidase domain